MTILDLKDKTDHKSVPVMLRLRVHNQTVYEINFISLHLN